MNYLRKLFWTVALASALSSTVVLSCGWSESEDFYYSKSFDILYSSLVKQYFVRHINYASYTYSDDEYNEQQATENYNLEAWSRYLKVSKEDARAIVYERAEDKLANQPAAIKTYLNIVAKQEPLAMQGDPRWLEEAERKKQKEANELLGKDVIAQIQQQLATEKDAFLRQRYAYLLVRAQHYTGHYQQVLDTYQQYQTDIQQPSTEVALWTGLLRAGALQRLDKPAEAAYQFATIFPQTRTKALTAQLNFKIRTDKEWNALMALCKTNDEKALMHFVRALRVNANSLEELKSVYALAPNSDWVDALLLRELQAVQFVDTVPNNKEEPWLQASRNINRAVLIDDQTAYETAKTEAEKQKLRDRRTRYLTKLSQIVDHIHQDKQRQDLFFTDYAKWYLQLLSGETVDVAALKSLETTYPNDKRLAYLKPLEHFIYLENLKTIDAPTEAVLAKNLQTIEALDKSDNTEGEEYEQKSRHLIDSITYTYAKLAPLYASTQQLGKAYLARKKGDIDLDEILVGEIRALQALQAKPSPNFLEQKMIAAFRQTSEEYESDPNELIARKYLAAGLLAKAKTAAEASNNKKFKTVYNPFTTGRSGNNRIKSKSMTLLQVINTLQQLEEEVTKNPRKAQSQFLLATGYYNMTWFGNSPLLLKLSRSTVNWDKGVTDFSQARKHYERALQYAPDNELKAKALYALAKIEKNELYLQQRQKGKDIYASWSETNDYSKPVKLAKKSGYGTYFRKIRDLEDTQYFKDVIQQCADYKYYFK